MFNSAALKINNNSSLCDIWTELAHEFKSYDKNI